MDNSDIGRSSVRNIVGGQVDPGVPRVDSLIRDRRSSRSGLSTISRGDVSEGKFANRLLSLSLCLSLFLVSAVKFRNCGTDYWLAKLGETRGRGWAE